MTKETIKDELNNVSGGLTVGDLIELLEQHRPKKTYSTMPGVSLVSCGVCDMEPHIWKDGDPPVECYQWRVVRPAVLKNFGLVEVNGVYDVVRG